MHTTVLLKETIDSLGLERISLKEPKIVVDGTLNNAGHTMEILNRYGTNVRLIGIDLSAAAIARANKRLAEFQARGAHIALHRENFRNVDTVLRAEKVGDTDVLAGMILDLGVSSEDLEISGRGFSFQKDEPLIMTYTEVPAANDITAAMIVNQWDEKVLADIFFGYGEERYARRIAREIVEAREKKRITTTFELVDIIKRAVPFPYRIGPTHFATRSFQALRIAVNDELGALAEAILKGFHALAPGGRLAIISFHSIEDRIVKRLFNEKVEEGKGLLLFKKPLTPSDEEIMKNRRSRSAKLRVIEKSLAK